MTEPDITRHYHRGNPESVAAHAETPAEARRKQGLRVYDYILSRGLEGDTSDEAEVALGLSHQACSARFTECKRGKLIQPGQRRRTRSGRWARAWVAVEYVRSLVF